jgi:hypothetical protein
VSPQFYWLQRCRIWKFAFGRFHDCISLPDYQVQRSLGISLRLPSRNASAGHRHDGRPAEDAEAKTWWPSGGLAPRR